jgi:hypothetical protein
MDDYEYANAFVKTMGTTRNINHHTRLLFTLVDHASDVLQGVVLAEEGEAIGHDFYLDKNFLSQLVEVCKEKGTIKVRANHPEDGKNADVLSIVGEASNFRIATLVRDGVEKLCVRADVKLFNVPQKKALLALAQEASAHFGMSLDFKGELSKKKVDGLPCITCEEVHAVDFVENPAAVSALFSKKDLTEKGKCATSPATEVTMGKTKLEEVDDLDETGDDEKEKKSYVTTAQLADLMKRIETLERALAEKDEEKEKQKMAEDDEDKKRKTIESDSLSENEVARIAARVTSIYLSKLGISPLKLQANEGVPGESESVRLSEAEKAVARKLSLGKGTNDEQIYAQRLAKLPPEFRSTCVALELDPDAYATQLRKSGQLK